MIVAIVHQMIHRLRRVLSHAVVEVREAGEDRVTTVISPEPETRKLVVAEQAKIMRSSLAGKTYTSPYHSFWTILAGSS